MSKRILYILLPIIAVAFLVTQTGCGSSSRARTAHYRGDVLYGDDSEKRHKGTHTSDPSVTRPIPASESLAKALTDPLERALVAEIEGWLGTPYRFGGQTKDGTDCSGMVMEVYRAVTGLKLPRMSREQYDCVSPLSRAELHPGDLMFYASDTTLSSVSHVGMYVGKGRMIHASVSRGVIVSDVDHQYWAKRLCRAGRVNGLHSAWNAIAGKSVTEDVRASVLETVIDQKTDSIVSSIFMD